MRRRICRAGLRCGRYKGESSPIIRGKVSSNQVTNEKDFEIDPYPSESLILRAFLSDGERKVVIFLYMAKSCFLFKKENKKRIYARKGNFGNFYPFLSSISPYHKQNSISVRICRAGWNPSGKLCGEQEAVLRCSVVSCQGGMPRWLKSAFSFAERFSCAI